MDIGKLYISKSSFTVFTSPEFSISYTYIYSKNYFAVYGQINIGRIFKMSQNDIFLSYFAIVNSAEILYNIVKKHW